MQTKGEMGALALKQLSAWEKIADTWVIEVLNLGSNIHLNCPACDTAFFQVDRDGVAYILTVEQIKAATVAHLRNRHRDLDPDHE